ncbi:DUF1376 domain-containing protein [Sphingomonas sp.]|uniref:DUF1376 domain-containing protein n=1 Tax=Sphingomonas sp. TaxID=28214 RepID=UPI0025D4E073|nr:DUF1376 domain-containing protein [Sphingomonas sp.]
MSLPWFGFNIKDFIANTQRLNTEAKGAYLMLLLDYYQNEQGCPADADICATTCGLSIEAWNRHSRVILPLFTIKAGILWHSRCEEEIAKGKELHAQRVKASEMAVAARAERKAARSTDRTTGRTTSGKSKKTENDRSVDRTIYRTVTEAVTEPVKTTDPIIAPDTETDTGPVTEPATQTQTHTLSKDKESLEREDAADAASLAQGESELSGDFKLTAADIVRCFNEGASSKDEVERILSRFFRHYQYSGTMSLDWKATWWKFWERNKPPVMPKAKPRVQVSRGREPATPTRKTSIPDDWKPKAAHHVLADDEGVNIDAIEQTFRDYCSSTGTKYADHDAAFRNFIRNQKNFTRGRTNGKAPTTRGSIVEAGNEAIAELDRRIEEAEARDRVGDVAVQSLPDERLRQSEGSAGDDGDYPVRILGGDREGGDEPGDGGAAPV